MTSRSTLDRATARKYSYLGDHSQVLHRLPDLYLAVEPEHLKWREAMRHRGVRELPVRF